MADYAALTTEERLRRSKALEVTIEAQLVRRKSFAGFAAALSLAAATIGQASLVSDSATATAKDLLIPGLAVVVVAALAGLGVGIYGRRQRRPTRPLPPGLHAVSASIQRDRDAVRLSNTNDQRPPRSVSE